MEQAEKHTTYQDTSYYDQESSIYSSKRYGGDLDTYTKYFFRKRLNILLKTLDEIFVNKTDGSLLDVGCADGVVTKKIEDVFSKHIKKIIAIDVSPEMIIEAKRKNSSEKISYFLRGEEPQNCYFDAVIEIGFLYEPLFEEEFAYVKSQLNKDGYFVCSIPNRHSIQALMKLRDKPYYKDYLSYKEYEKIFEKHFEIIQKEPYGFFVPKLWAFPFLAKHIQPILDSLLKNIVPELFHEKLYLLKVR